MRRVPLWSLLLLAVPAAWVLHSVRAGPAVTFLVSALGLIPLAILLGRATEVLAHRLGPNVGGLINATLGNAAELILGVMALRRGLLDVVKASLIGSIIGNALLVLGLSLLVGGLRHHRQRFDRVSAGLQSTLLALAAIGLIVPSALFPELGPAVELRLSLQVAAVLLGTYVLSLVFTLATHRGGDAEVMESLGQEIPRMRLLPATSLLVVSAAFVAVLSEILVDALERARQGGLLAGWGMSEVFVGVVVVAVVGNAAEHSTAVVMAYRNRVDLTLHVAIGSSLQIALLVTPVLTFASLVVAPAPLDLHFRPLEVMAVGASVVVVALVAADGESHWMEGVLLLALYLILALAFYHVPVTAP